MLRNKSSLEVANNGKIFQFICDSDTPIPVVIQALEEMKNYCDQVLKNSLESFQAKEHVDDQPKT